MRKRILVRADASARNPIISARPKITEIIPEEADVKDIVFDEVRHCDLFVNCDEIVDPRTNIDGRKKRNADSIIIVATAVPLTIFRR